MDPRRALGTDGERLAEHALAKHGLRTVARNARTRWGEIDLVCREARGYVFVEVKTRRHGSFVSALEAVDRRKAERLARLAIAWLAARGERDAAWRLALAAVTLEGGTATVEFVALDDLAG
ncbi:MAG: YraN family protein [Chloroflexi bacterium]|nr:YraN family protein [Chloroflexota bacterium]